MSREKDEKNTQEIRNRILDASVVLFSEKGFDATGIAEIASEAGVTKSLIYYYFKNKDDILAGIFARFLQETLAMKASVMSPVLSALKANAPREFYRYMKEYSLPFIEAHRRVFKIALVEEVKNPAEGPLFQYFKGNLAAGLQYFEKAGIQIDKYPDLSAFTFFALLFPAMGYTMLGEEWCEHTGMEKAELDAKLTSWLADSFARYLFGKGLED